jgi:hypothetical protein
MASDESPPCLLLALPDPCMLAVLQCCAVDQHTLFCAARAHSRLHKAAVLAVRSITAVLTDQQQADDMCMYLTKHSQHIDRIHLKATRDEVSIRQLPATLRLHSFVCENICVQLQPGEGFQGVLGLAALKQLQLRRCELLPTGADEGLEVALSQLPAGFEHLSISMIHFGNVWSQASLNSGALQQLQQLTYLDLTYLNLKRPSQGEPALQALKSLPQLARLRLTSNSNDTIDASVFAGMRSLTWLELSGFILESDGLSGSTQLQHLALQDAFHAHDILDSGAVAVSQLMSQLHYLQQLTHLSLSHSSTPNWEQDTKATPAYSALTASSKLHRLEFSSCRLPSGVWQHMFPAGRQLPDLRVLDISGIREPTGWNAPAPDSSRLVSCCPALEHLDMRRLQYRTELLAPLTELSGLRTLLVAADDQEADTGLPAVCQLTGLRELYVWESSSAKHGLLLQLTQLQQLTALTHIGPAREIAESGSDGDGMGDDDWMGDGMDEFAKLYDTVELICQVSLLWWLAHRGVAQLCDAANLCHNSAQQAERIAMGGNAFQI